MATPNSRRQYPWRFPLAIVIVALIGFLTTNYFHQQFQFREMNEELQRARAAQTEQARSQTEQLGRRAITLSQFSEQLAHQQKRLDNLEKSLAIERPIQNRTLEQLRADMDSARRTEEDLGRAIQKLQAHAAAETSAVNKTISEKNRASREKESALAEREKASVPPSPSLPEDRSSPP